ncbi:MAG TPA: transposase [Verrucomicrobiae bacterium]|nr:transposase [Verrucomicrobiae bacterium]
MNQLPKHPHRLPVILPLEVGVIYYVTCCTHDRRRVFTTEARVALALGELRETSRRLARLVGGVVVMLDHVHFFCSPMDRDGHVLPSFVGAWRAAVTRRLSASGIHGSVWQKSFFDHMLRSDESYGNKWEYVRRNPDRAGLNDFRRWFEIDPIRFR